MKRAFSILAVCAAFSWVALAAAVDGKWVAKVERPAGKKQGAAARGPIEIVFDLKTDGNTLTGTVTGGAGGRSRSNKIETGTVDGNKISFTTVNQGPNGERKITWEATVDGDQLKGTRSVEGRRAFPFTATRQQQ